MSSQLPVSILPSLPLDPEIRKTWEKSILSQLSYYCRYVFLRNGALYCAVGIDSDEFSIVNYNADTIDALLGELATQLSQTRRELNILAEDASVQFGATLFFNNGFASIFAKKNLLPL